MKSKYITLISILTLASVTASAQVDTGGGIGPLPYLQRSDSPWFSSLTNGMFFLEDFEDGVLNTPGLTASAGSVIGPGGLTDSVDGDDGVINGSGTQGRSFFRNNAASGIEFTFGSGTYGALPTSAGLVWTDGATNGTTRFEAFDEMGSSLGIITGNHASTDVSGTTAEDRFYGWMHAGGISRIKITHSGGGGIEVDHIQYGTVPEPATMTALGLGVLALMRRRRRCN